MFISHEGVAVNLDRVDYIKIERNCITDVADVTKGYGIVLQLADERMTITASEPMTVEEAKVVYGTILAAMNGTFFDSRTKEFHRSEKIFNMIGIDKEEVDSIIKAYHEEKDSQ